MAIGQVAPDRYTCSEQRGIFHQIPHWNEIGVKAWYRQISREVMKQKISPKLIKEIIKLYHFEQSRPFPMADSFLKLEKMFRIDSVAWPDYLSKVDTIHLKAQKELNSLLLSYG